MTARRVGRPRTTVLTLDRILDAAFELAGARSIRGFTMTALAESLDVRISALYYHVASRADLIAQMRGRLSRMIDMSAFATAPLLDAIVSWGRSYRATLLSASDAIVLFATLPIDTDLTAFENYEVIARRLSAEGWPEERIVDTIVAIESFIVGSALDALAPRGNMHPGVFSEEVPGFAAADAVRAAQSADPAERTFEIGLRAITSGLRDWALHDVTE